MIFLLLLIFVQSKLYENDLKLINIEPIDKNQIQQDLVESFQNHDIKQDQEYLENQEYYDELIKIYQNQLDNKFDLYGLKKENGKYGLFTSQFIPNNTVIGLRYGILTDNQNSNYLQYEYYSKLDGKDIFVDINNKSNIFRFAQMNSQANVDAINIPYNNQWNIMVISNQDISENQEILFENDEEYQEFFGQRLQNTDLHRLNLVHLNESIIEDEELKEILQDHDVFQDKNYLDYKMTYDGYIEFIDKFYTDYIDIDEYVYIQYLSSEFGFGAFAKQKLYKNMIVGEYTGIIQKDDRQNGYAWSYPSKPNNLTLMVNSNKKGNILRFVNDYEYHNIKAVQVPTKKGWKTFYQVVQTIDQDEELSVNYGEGYWKQKEKLKRDPSLYADDDQEQEQSNQEKDKQETTKLTQSDDL